jgi:DNA-binding GntR family transcriptional regulator
VPRASDAEQLLALHARLSQALQCGDWRAVEETDQAIRQCLASLGTLDAPAQAARSRLKQLHGEAMQACAQECERLRLLLAHHLESAEGRAAYQLTDMIQAGAGR